MKYHSMSGIINTGNKFRIEEVKKMTVREARHLCGLTQQEVSSLLGIPKRTLENWETGLREPPEYVEKLVVQRILCMEGKEKAAVEKEVKRIVDNAVASLAMEGMICTEEEKELAAKVIRGKILESDAIQNIISRYREVQP